MVNTLDYSVDQGIACVYAMQVASSFQQLCGMCEPRSNQLSDHVASCLPSSHFPLPLPEVVLPNVDNLQTFGQNHIQSRHGLCINFRCRSATHARGAVVPFWHRVHQGSNIMICCREHAKQLGSKQKQFSQAAVGAPVGSRGRSCLKTQPQCVPLGRMHQAADYDLTRAQ